MEIRENRIGILAYTIQLENASGEILEEASKEHPRSMLFGSGRILKSFDQQLLGLRSGDQFEFILSPEEGFGEYKEDLLMDVPRSVFSIDGQLQSDMLEIGRVIPMMDRQGNPFDGKVLAINGDFIRMDFNHPLAGKSLYTRGEILNVREATEAELNPSDHGCGCGSDNEGGCCGGGHHDHHHDSDGCGCHEENSEHQCGCHA